MRISFSRYSLLLLLGFVALVLNSCNLPAAADPPPQVTPDTTDPSTLIVMMTINDDENATDGKVGISLQIATNEIKDANYIAFTKGEEVFCNRVRLTFNALAYTARVSAVNGRFTCDYVRNGTAYSISEPERPLLKPVLAHNTFVLSYTPESRGLSYCPMRVDLADPTPTNISYTFTEGASGRYTVNPSTLSGVGSLFLTRTCSHTLTGHATSSDTVDKHAATPFGSVTITYISIWRLFVTWI